MGDLFCLTTMKHWLDTILNVPSFKEDFEKTIFQASVDLGYSYLCFWHTGLVVDFHLDNQLQLFHKSCNLVII